MFINNLLDRITIMNRRDKVDRIRARTKAAHHIAAGMCFIAAAGICAAAGFLLTTKTGKEIREKMKSKVNGTVENLKYYAVKNSDAVAASAVHTAEKVNSFIDASQDKVEGIKKEFSEGQDKIIKDIRDTADSIVREAKENNQ